MDQRTWFLFFQSEGHAQDDHYLGDTLDTPFLTDVVLACLLCKSNNTMIPSPYHQLDIRTVAVTHTTHYSVPLLGPDLAYKLIITCAIPLD